MAAVLKAIGVFFGAVYQFFLYLEKRQQREVGAEEVRKEAAEIAKAQRKEADAIDRQVHSGDLDPAVLERMRKYQRQDPATP